MISNVGVGGADAARCYGWYALGVKISPNVIGVKSKRWKIKWLDMLQKMLYCKISWRILTVKGGTGSV